MFGLRRKERCFSLVAFWVIALAVPSHAITLSQPVGVVRFHEADKILDSLPVRLGTGPKFKVIYSVITSYPISMVDGFESVEFPSDVFLHYKTMFWNIFPIAYMNELVTLGIEAPAAPAMSLLANQVFGHPLPAAFVIAKKVLLLELIDIPVNLFSAVRAWAVFSGPFAFTTTEHLFKLISVAWSVECPATFFIAALSSAPVHTRESSAFSGAMPESLGAVVVIRGVIGKCPNIALRADVAVNGSDSAYATTA